VADGTPTASGLAKLPPPPAEPRPPPTQPTPTVTPSRDPTDSALATKLVSLPEVEEARASLSPMPAVPDGGLFESARYAVLFAIARWQRRRVIGGLSTDVTRETGGLDGIFGELGRAARVAKIVARPFADENLALDEAERRRGFAEQACADLTGKKTEENAKFEAVQHDLAARLSEREEELKIAAAELERVDGTRRGLRDRRRDLEKSMRALSKSAQERDDQAARSQMGDSRSALRAASEELRREARKLADEGEEIDARLAGLEKPLGDAQARHEAARATTAAAKTDLQNAREGHRHRTAEIEAEQARRSRELIQADAEIHRRLVTLGTIVNLNRVALPEFQALYERADDLRAKIATREQEIDRLKAERESYDRPSLIRGGAVLAAAAVMLVTSVWIAVALIV
jgi:hypothetical protein